MGSGGLRGLQILRSGVQSARGGFDSHAFPPILAALTLAAGLLAADAARAQDRLAPPDSVGVPESGAVITVPDTAAAPASGPKLRTGRFDQPRFVMLRSLLVPGWGQFHNRAWIKAGLVAGGEIALLSGVLEDRRALDDLEAVVNAARAAGNLEEENQAVDRYNARLDRYVGRQWLLGAVVVYALMDAYVDAHFVNFKVEFENDPARPPGVKLGMEMHF